MCKHKTLKIFITFIFLCIFSLSCQAIYGVTQKEIGETIASFAINFANDPDGGSNWVYDGDYFARGLTYNAQKNPDGKWHGDCVGWVTFCLKQSINMGKNLGDVDTGGSNGFVIPPMRNDGGQHANAMYQGADFNGTKDFLNLVTDGSLMPGDILMNDHHVMIYVGKIDGKHRIVNSRQPFLYETFESYAASNYDKSGCGPEGVYSHVYRVSKTYANKVDKSVLKPTWNGKSESIKWENGEGTTTKNGVSWSEYLLKQAKKCHDFVRDRKMIYGGSTIPLTGSTVDCSAYVSYVLYESGFGDMAGDQHTTYNDSFGTYGQAKGWERITRLEDLKPGDICFFREGERGPEHMNIFVEKKGNDYYCYDCGNTERIQAEDTIVYTMNTFVYAYRTKPSDGFDGTDDSDTGSSSSGNVDNFEGDPSHQVSANDKKKDFRIVDVNDKIAIYKHILFTEKYNFNRIQWKQYGHGANGTNSPMTEDQVYGLKYPKDDNNTKLGKFVSLVLPYLQTWYIPLGMYSGILNSGVGKLGTGTNISGESNFSGSTNAEIIWNFLRSKGLPEVQTAAVLGNIEQEARFNPAAVQSNGVGHGIVQWSDSRCTQLMNYASSVGKDWSDLSVQLEFLWGEMQRDGGGVATFQFLPASTYDQFMNASTPTEAANIFCTGFERPNESDANRPVRTQAAENYFKLYQGKTATDTSKTSIAGTAKATEKQMKAYLKTVNPNVSKEILNLVPIYLEEGRKEGIRGDIAFAQSCVETRNFTFTGTSIELSQNNFGSLGVTSKAGGGDSYRNATLGIRAQIQHLKAFANKDDLKQKTVDKNFSSVKRGTAQYVEYLGSKENPNKTGWSNTEGYGNKIMDVLDKVVGGNTTSTSKNTSTSDEEQNSKNHYFAYSTIKNAFHEIIVNRYDIQKKTVNTKYNEYTRYTKKSTGKVIETRIYNTKTGLNSTSCRLVDRQEVTVGQQYIDERADSSGTINPANETYLSEETDVETQYYLNYALTFDMVYSNNYNYTKYNDADVTSRINADSEQVTATQPYYAGHAETRGNILPGEGYFGGSAWGLGAESLVPDTGPVLQRTEGVLEFYTQTFTVTGHPYLEDSGKTVFMRRTWKDKLTQGNSKAEQVSYDTMVQYNKNQENNNLRSTISTKEFESGDEGDESYRTYKIMSKQNSLNLIDIVNSNPKLMSTYMAKGSEYSKYMGYTRSYLSMSYQALKSLIDKTRGDNGAVPYAYFVSLGYNVSKTDNELKMDTGSYGGFGWPVNIEGNDGARVINTIYPYTAGYGGTHGAIDIGPGNGDNSIIASKDGTVIKSGVNGGYGNSVLIDHGDGFYTRYSHMSKIQEGIMVGAKVKKGDKLGMMGTTGNSTGTHLDFEIYKDGLNVTNRVDPLDYFNTEPEYGSINPEKITGIPSGYKFKSEKKNKGKSLPIIFVGDSRTVGMKQAVNDTANTYIAEVGKGYAWLSTSGVDQLQKLLDKNPNYNVVFAMGVNDCAEGNGLADKYIALYQTLKEKYKKTGFYFMAVNPVVDGKSNAKQSVVQAFNKSLKDAFPGDYIDTYTYLMEKGFNSPDGLHYDTATYQTIFKFVKEKLPSGGGNLGDILFFTKSESGDDAYGQTGGDGGNACGKYQFDYRYALLPFLQSVVNTYPEFKEFANLDKSALQGNQRLYATWKAVYAKDPEGFKAAQDQFAYDNYYMEAERNLSSMGVNISGRPDAIKGAVFSYAIQHGSYTAAQAVVSAGINNATSDREFIEKIYNYRISRFPSYSSRYTAEKADALSLL